MESTSEGKRRRIEGKTEEKTVDRKEKEKEKDSESESRAEQSYGIVSRSLSSSLPDGSWI